MFFEGWGLLRSRRGFTRQPENSKRAHFRAPALQTPPKFHERTPKRGREERKLWREKGKQSAKFWPSPFGAPAFGALPFVVNTQLAEVKIGRSRSRSGGGCSTSANSLAQRRPFFLLLWAVWASEALYGQGPVPSGRVGRIASPWCPDLVGFRG